MAMAVAEKASASPAASGAEQTQMQNFMRGIGEGRGGQDHLADADQADVAAQREQPLRA